MKFFYRYLGFSLIGLLLVTATHAATITVTSSADSGPGTLRQAIADANSGDTINFSFTSPTVVILASELTINKSLTLVGPGASLLTISGNDSVRVVRLTSGTSTISGLTISHGRITNNNGAGVHIGSSAVLSLDQCAITNNVIVVSNSDCFGAGVFNSGSLSMNRCHVANNVFNNPTNGMYNDTGGGLYLENAQTALYNCSIVNNASYIAGAIGGSLGVLSCTNVTISGNNSTHNGVVYYNNGTLVLNQCTITGNASLNSVGGILCSICTITMQSTIVAGNQVQSGPNSDIYFDDTFTSLGNNLVGSAGNTNPYTWTTGDVVGIESSKVPANLAPLADYGGYVQTCLPASSSQAVDPATGGSVPFVDARGYLRVNTADKGSAEYGGTLPVATAATSVGFTGFTANWDLVAGAQGYALDVATDSAFASMVSGWGNSLVGNASFWNVTGLTSGITYYYRIRAVSGEHLSYHSNTVSCTVLVPTPTATVTPTITATATVTPTLTASATFTPTVSMTPTCIALDLQGKPVLAYPNPGREKVILAFQPISEGEAKVQIYNMSGERVTVLNAQVSGEITASVIWECTTVAPGLYVVRVVQDGREIGKTKVAVVR